MRPPGGAQSHRLRTTSLEAEKLPALLLTIRQKPCQVQGCRRGTPVMDSRKTQCPPRAEAEMD